MINDTQSLVGARQSRALNEYGTPITIYDDGFGSLWLYREAGGLQGIVRAMSWEAAYEICQDEIMTRVSQDEVIEAYGFYVLQSKMLEDLSYDPGPLAHVAMRDCGEYLAEFNTRDEAEKYCLDTIQREECDLVEGYEYQPNATGTGIVSFDLNGQDLVQLTPELAERLEIRIQVEECA